MILVVGSTGFLGERVAERLILSGERVRALVRAGSRAETLEAAGAEIVLGDMKDRASLDAACAGVRMVVSTANAAARGGADTPETVDLQGNQNLIEAATAAQVKKFVFVSAYGVTPESPVPFFRAKAHTEERLMASGLDWVIVAPDLFAEIWIPMVVGAKVAADQPVMLVGDANHRHSFISVDDVAAFTVKAARSDALTARRLEIGGPDALSWSDVVGIYERVLGRELPVSLLEPGAPVPGLPETVAGMLNMMETYDSVIDTTALAHQLGITQTPVEAVIRNQLVGA